jgi:D-tyrosyl-tRNA(Tyr) deacylase
MKVVIQRVSRAWVKIEHKIRAKIGPGLLILIGVGEKDNKENIKEIAGKILKLRIFENGQEKFDKSVLNIKGEILVVPQFTLFADCSKGNRPYFGSAARPGIAKPLYEKFIEELRKSGLRVESGVFGAKMEVELINNGPVTIIVESEK